MSQSDNVKFDLKITSSWKAKHNAMASATYWTKGTSPDPLAMYTTHLKEGDSSIYVVSQYHHDNKNCFAKLMFYSNELTWQHLLSWHVHICIWNVWVVGHDVSQNILFKTTFVPHLNFIKWQILWEMLSSQVNLTIRLQRLWDNTILIINLLE